MCDGRSILRGRLACIIFCLSAAITMLTVVYMIVVVIWQEFIFQYSITMYAARIIGAVLGFSQVVTAPLIFIGMLLYIWRYDSTSISVKMLWMAVFLCVGWIGASLYCIVSYYPKECRCISMCDLVRPETWLESQGLSGGIADQAQSKVDDLQESMGFLFLNGCQLNRIFLTCVWIIVVIVVLVGLTAPLYDVLFADAIKHILVVRCAAAFVGAVGILACLILFAAMANHLIRRDRSSRSAKVIWFLFFLLPWIGPPVYYLVKYRKIGRNWRVEL